MSTHSLIDLATSAPLPHLAEPTRIETVLVATDGAHESDVALVVARAVADRHAAALQILSACEPSVADLARDPLSPPLPPGALAEERDARLADVRRQLARALGRCADCPVAVAGDALDAVLGTIVRSVGADMVVMGRGRHGAIDRLLHDEHVIRAVRTGDVPVLAVAAGTRGLPKRAVIAIDFSADSLRAARVALSTLADDATVYLAHVTNPPSVHLRHGDTWVAERDRALRVNLDRVRTALAAPATMIVENVVLTGYPPSTIVDFAHAAHADVVVVGAHGRGFVQRSVVGRVATYTIRAAHTSVLCVPPIDAHTGERVRAPHRFAHSIPNAAWRESLDAFVAAHRAEPVRVIALRIGARAPAVYSGTLLDIASEPDGFIIDTSRSGGAHGERVRDVTAITIHRGARTGDELLEIEHAAGRTRLDTSQ